MSDVEVVAGKGIAGTVDGVRVAVGSARNVCELLQGEGQGLSSAQVRRACAAVWCAGTHLLIC